MATNLLLTYVGEDRPGIVQELSALVSAHGGNWLSKMSRMGGRFAGIAGGNIAHVEGLGLRSLRYRDCRFIWKNPVYQADPDTLTYDLTSWALIEQVFYRGYD